MKKNNGIFIFLFVVITSASAQTTFQKTYGGNDWDRGYAVSQTSDGGYATIGTTNYLSATSYDIYLIKTDSLGNVAWNKTYGGADAEYGYSLKETSDGGYIISGFTNSFGSGSSDVYLLKTDSAGNLLWSKAYGGVLADVSNSGRETNDGGYILAGATLSFGQGKDDYLIKVDSAGNVLWSKTYGGNSADEAYDIQQTNDGGYIITGRTYYVFGAGNYDVYLVKTDSTGLLLWSKTFGGTDTDESKSVQQTSDGGFIVAGTTSSFGSGSSDVYLIKTDSAGNLLWAKTYGSPFNDVGYSVQQTADDGYIIAGSTGLGSGVGDVYLVKTDSAGNLLWSKTFGGTTTEAGYCVQQTNDGGYIVTGVELNLTPGGNNVYLIKTDANGNSGCHETSPATLVTTPASIVTSPLSLVTYPSTITGNAITVVSSGGIANTLCVSIGVGVYNTGHDVQPEINISPNPTTGKFEIILTKIINTGTVQIYDVLGVSKLEENIFSSAGLEINLKNIAAGIYSVKVFDGEKYYNKKIIIVQD